MGSNNAAGCLETTPFEDLWSDAMAGEQIVEQFQPVGMIDARLQLAEPEVLEPLTGDLAVSNLSLAEDDSSRVLDAVSFIGYVYLHNRISWI